MTFGPMKYEGNYWWWWVGGLLGKAWLSEKEKHGMKWSLFPSGGFCPECDGWDIKSQLTAMLVAEDRWRTAEQKDERELGP